MKKSTGLIIWSIALIALLGAAYTFYEKNKAQFIIRPPVQETTTNGSAEQNTSAVDTTDNSAAGQESAEQGASGQESAEQGASGQEPSADDGARSDKIMAPDFTLKDMDGNETSLSDYRGKIVILNFWAVWCKYCVEEMPDLNKLDKELKEAGDAVILAVNVGEPYDTVKKFLDEKDIDLKVLMDEDGTAAATYGIEGYPTTFFLNADGSVYTYIPGAADFDTFRKVLDMTRNGEPLK